MHCNLTRQIYSVVPLHVVYMTTNFMQTGHNPQKQPTVATSKGDLRASQWCFIKLNQSRFL